VPNLVTNKLEDETFSYREIFNTKLKSESENSKIQILASLKQMLIDYMLSIKSQKNEEYTSILFKLCAECRPKAMADEEFYKSLSLKFCLQNIQLLKDYKRFHSTALIYHLLNQNEDAFSIWKE
jgi:hypothetical protein